jgi:hypothetical protein
VPRSTLRVDTWAMDRNEILKQLAVIEEHMGQGEQHIRRQREIIDDLVCHGQDVIAARELLSAFEKTLARHTNERSRVLRELAGEVTRPTGT